MHDKVEIFCPLHGTFFQNFHMHINKKRGCPLCGIDKHRDTLGDFVRKSNLIHLYKYTYFKTKYVDSKTKVIITCPIHGDFLQRPCDHINSEQGCPKCNQSKGEVRINRILNIYYLLIFIY